jgi:tRNA(fMet)-specific endonuclease VapC
VIYIIDTNIAVHLLDGDPTVSARVHELPVAPVISVLTRVELEGGVYRDPEEAAVLRPRLDLILEGLDILPFTGVEAEIYGRIVEGSGYSRAKVIDRMIAATAIAADATLITLNSRDFRNIAGLRLEDWSS